MDRRQFLSTAAAVTTLASLPRDTFAQDLLDIPKKRVGLIGCGWYGKCDLLRLIQVAPVEVVSICDVDTQMRQGAADIIATRQKSGKQPRQFGDYREMLKEKDLDICLIGTPDHWHALTMIEAVRSGADVYAQKPISRDIVEGQAMVAAARKYDRVVQVGTQRRSTAHLIEAKQKVVEEGLLGTIGHAEVCCYYGMGRNATAENCPPPEYLDFDMWTGPAPKLPFNPVMHPRSWRMFKEFGNGIMGDMCIHMLDTVRWMLDLGWPTSVNSRGGTYVWTDATGNVPDTQVATFDFPELDVVWTHRAYGDAPDRDYPWAVFLYGDKGTLKASVNKYEFFPRGRREPTLTGAPKTEWDKYPEDQHEKDLEQHVAAANRAHQLDFLKAIQDRSKPVADIEQGHISTASCILANMSLELGRSLAWDPEKQQVIGDDEANSMLARDYRDGWEHPTVDNI
ncbi:Gfo/Idh/MocA family protein [Blastopirellula marina]|uniref:Oxidoreductase n=1 Tax=Blastopirellula marina TaxID=124 RepID=A0A2S8GPS3_9BACT|nr:Gfo/Idh/MocA family oxidoreductase [Blastopirellula marina]PQO46351.1 oxidoreductase [Blastopirellula marina]